MGGNGYPGTGNYPIAIKEPISRKIAVFHSLYHRIKRVVFFAM